MVLVAAESLWPTFNSVGRCCGYPVGLSYLDLAISRLGRLAPEVDQLPPQK